MKAKKSSKVLTLGRMRSEFPPIQFDEDAEAHELVMPGLKESQILAECIEELEFLRVVADGGRKVTLESEKVDLLIALRSMIMAKADNIKNAMSPASWEAIEVVIDATLGMKGIELVHEASTLPLRVDLHRRMLMTLLPTAGAEIEAMTHREVLSIAVQVHNLISDARSDFSSSVSAKLKRRRKKTNGQSSETPSSTPDSYSNSSDTAPVPESTKS